MTETHCLYKRTLSGWSPIPSFCKLVADCPQTLLLVLLCTNKALCRAVLEPSRSCYCNQSVFRPGFLFSARKTTITTSAAAHKPPKSEAGQKRVGAPWMLLSVLPVEHNTSGSKVTGTSIDTLGLQKNKPNNMHQFKIHVHAFPVSSFPHVSFCCIQITRAREIPGFP